MAIIPFLLFLCLLLAFPGCTKREGPSLYDSPGKPAHGDTIITASIGEASSLVPMLASDAASHDIASYVYNGLVKYDKDLSIAGDLAESWEISKDNLTIVFHLKKGVRWHDGTPFTAHDVMFTYKTIIDPKTPTAYSGDFRLVKSAQVVGDHTFRVTYDKPFSQALISWGVAVMPRHLLEGKDITASPLIRSPVGTGPYRFKEWIPGDRVVLSANADYFQGKPYVDRRITRVIPDSATMFLELKRFAIDMMGLTPLQYMKQTDYAGFKREFSKYSYLAFSYVYMGYNLKNPLFKDKRVRQAMSYAIDKKEIVDGILMGQGVEATGPFKPDMWAHNGKVKRYDHSKDRALALLGEAGYTKGADGMLTRDGKPFEFTIFVNQGNEVRIRCAELIQRRLSEVGISVKIRVIEWASLINEFIDKRNFEAIILGWTMSPEPDLFDVWHSSKQGKRELNFISFENAEVDDLIVRARHTLDRAKQKAYYDRVQEILAEEQPYTFLFVPYTNLAVHRRIKGIDPGPSGVMWNTTEWYVPQEQQRYRTHAALSP